MEDEDDNDTDSNKNETVYYEELCIEKIDERKNRNLNLNMLNPMMMLKKVVDHPYLINFSHNESSEFLVDESLVTSSGKMLVLDAMLAKLKKEGHKVRRYFLTL